MTWWKIAAAVGLSLLYTFLIHSCGQESGRLEGALAYSQLESDLAKAKNQASTDKQELERQLAAQSDRNKNAHSQAMDSMQRDITVAHAESDSLRGQLEALRGRLQRLQPADSSAGFQYAPGVKAAMVLSELYASCSAERSELAGKYDKSHARGLAVEQQYDYVRGQLLKLQNKETGQ